MIFNKKFLEYLDNDSILESEPLHNLSIDSSSGLYTQWIL